jgi:hypothetical protein
LGDVSGRIVLAVVLTVGIYGMCELDLRSGVRSNGYRDCFGLINRLIKLFVGLIIGFFIELFIGRFRFFFEQRVGFCR